MVAIGFFFFFGVVLFNREEIVCWIWLRYVGVDGAVVIVVVVLFLFFYWFCPLSLN